MGLAHPVKKARNLSLKLQECFILAGGNRADSVILVKMIWQIKFLQNVIFMCGPISCYINKRPIELVYLVFLRIFK